MVVLWSERLYGTLGNSNFIFQDIYACFRITLIFTEGKRIIKKPGKMTQSYNSFKYERQDDLNLHLLHSSLFLDVFCQVICSMKSLHGLITSSVS